MLPRLAEADFVLLWTDALVFLLVTAVLGFVWYASTREHLRAPWHEVFRKPMGVSAFVVLCVYVLIGLTDSVHYQHRIGEDLEGQPQYASHITSLLDEVLQPLPQNVEKTYSAPFALHLYAKETIEDEFGGKRREYPRLAFGGTHVNDAATEHTSDIATRISIGVLGGLASGIVIIGLVTGFLSQQYKESWRSVSITMLKGQRDLPWRSLLGTIVCITVFVAVLLNTATTYHVFGTDKVGEDVLYQSLKSIRTGLMK